MDGGVNVGCGPAMIFCINPRIALVQLYEIEVQLVFRLIHHRLVVWGLVINDEIDTKHSIDIIVNHPPHRTHEMRGPRAWTPEHPGA